MLENINNNNNLLTNNLIQITGPIRAVQLYNENSYEIKTITAALNIGCPDKEIFEIINIENDKLYFEYAELRNKFPEHKQRLMWYGTTCGNFPILDCESNKSKFKLSKDM